MFLVSPEAESNPSLQRCGDTPTPAQARERCCNAAQMDVHRDSGGAESAASTAAIVGHQLSRRQSEMRAEEHLQTQSLKKRLGPPEP